MLTNEENHQWDIESLYDLLCPPVTLSHVLASIGPSQSPLAFIMQAVFPSHRSTVPCSQSKTEQVLTCVLMFKVGVKQALEGRSQPEATGLNCSNEHLSQDFFGLDK